MWEAGSCHYLGLVKILKTDTHVAYANAMPMAIFNLESAVSLHSLATLNENCNP